MVRPRCGDFLYSTAELEVMIEDIQSFKSLGVTGVVFGILTSGGQIDVDRTILLIRQALPVEGANICHIIIWIVHICLVKSASIEPSI